MCRGPICNYFATATAHCVKGKFAAGETFQQTGQLDLVGWRERATIESFADQIRRASAGRRNQDREAGCHCFIYHQTPLFAQTGMDKNRGETVIVRQRLVALLAGKYHVLAQPKFLDQNLRPFLQRPASDQVDKLRL